MKRSKKDRQREKAEREAEEAKAKADEFSADEATKTEVKDITFAGETLEDYPAKYAEDKGAKISNLKTYIRAIPTVLEQMPKPKDFSIVKIDSLILLEIAREWHRRNLAADVEVAKHRASVPGVDKFDSSGFPEVAKDILLAWILISEADSYYGSRGRDLICTCVTMYESLDMNWSQHMMICEPCQTEMNFVNVMETKDNLAWMTFSCPKCGRATRYAKRMFFRDLSNMWDHNEMANHETFRLQEHVKHNHPEAFTTTEYQMPVKGCETCEGISEERKKKLATYNEIYKKYREAFRETFEVSNPFTGEVYEKKEEPSKAAKKVEELKEKRKPKKKGAKK